MRNVTALKSKFKTIARREALLFLAMLLIGVGLLPAVIYIVGQSIFGEYGGSGIFDFFERIYAGIASGENVIWFLVASPYLVVQLLRLTFRLFRRSKQLATN